MKILVLSDIHENFDNLVNIFKEIKNKNIQQIICLGDLINNGIAKVLVAHNIPIHLIWGNNDGEVVNVTKTFLNSGNTVAETVFDSVEFGGRKIFLTHYTSIAKPMAKSGDYDAIFYGHDHKMHEEVINNCYVLNPGEVGAHKRGISSYAIYDTDTNRAKIIKLESISCVKNQETSDYIKQLKFEFSQTGGHKF